MRLNKLCFLAAVLFCAAPLLHARPEFLARFTADPFARPERRGKCSTCHVNPAGGGPRNPFGLAFARTGHRVTPELRAQWPDRFLASLTAEAPAPQAPAAQPLKATWSATRESEVLIDVGGERYLLNRADASIRKVDDQQAQAFLQPAQPAALRAGEAAAAQAPAAEVPAAEVRPPTFDYYLVNLPTTRARPPHSLHLRFTHRFFDPVAQGTGRLRDLFGFDSYSISSFGVELGLLKHVSFVTYRSPLLRTAGGPTIELGPMFPLLQQGGRVPVSFSVRATVEGQRNFTERFTTNLVPVISRSFAGRAEFFVAPAFSLGVPRRTLTFDFPTTPGERRDNLVALGLGASLRLLKHTAVVGEWHPRLAGFRGFGTRNTYAFAIQRTTSTGRHVFALVFSNTQSTTTARSVTDGLDDLRIGFNLYRRLW